VELSNLWQKVRDHTKAMSARRVALIRAAIIGLVAGCSALALEYGAWWLSKMRVQACNVYPAWLALPLIGLVGGLLSGFLVQKFSPTAYGSGIPQVRAYLLGARVPLDFTLALVKLVGGSIALGCGLFMGREGPTVHVGAAMAALLNRWLPAPKDVERQLVAAGAGAGLAAAFNAPIAGVLFVAEELLKDVSSGTIGTAILACFVASTLTHTLNAPHMESAQQIRALEVSFHFHDVLFWIVLGTLAGLFGTWFNRGVILFLRINRDYLKLPVMLRVGLAGLISGLVISAMPADANFRDYAALRDVIVAGHEQWYMVPVAFVAFSFLTLLAYGSGAPGGLFAPAIVLGSALGAMVSYLQNYLFNMSSTETMAMVGMGAFFAAVARVPITAVVIIFEITGHYSLVLPLMVASAIACFVGSRMEKGSVYDMLREYSGLEEAARRAREDEQKHAGDLMKPPKNCVDSELAPEKLFDAIKQTHIASLTVVDGEQYVGMVDSKSVLSLLSLSSTSMSSSHQLIDKDAPLVAPNTSLAELVLKFKESSAETIPVVEDGKLLGIIDKADLYEYISPANPSNE
jgi:CIC family chloride channel protein